MNISEALLELDPENDDQWTVDGYPRMSAIEKLVPHNPDMTRKDVINASPNFNRDMARKLVAERAQESGSMAGSRDKGESTPKPGTLSDGAKPTSYLPEDPTPETKPELIGDGIGTVLDPVPDYGTIGDGREPHTQPTEMDGLQVNLAEKTKLMDEAYQVAEKSKKEADGLADEVNALNRQIDSLTRSDPNAATAGIRAYINQQNENRRARALGMSKFLRDTGLTKKDMNTLTNPLTPLDRALSLRKASPTTRRPNHPRLRMAGD